MFKKMIIAVISASFVASAAFADSTNIGVRLSAANMAASGTETTNLAGTNVSQAEKDADFILPSIFVERQMELESGLSIAVGLDFVPLTEEVDTLGGATGTGAKISAGNLFTAYLQPSFSVNENLSVFGKIGYAQGDLEVDDLKRQATTAGTASTDTSGDKDLEGPVYGLGVQINNDIGAFNFIRLEATRTDFDKVSHTNSNGKKLTADAEMDLITLTIGKSF
jgi:hypothetical protein